MISCVEIANIIKEMQERLEKQGGDPEVAAYQCLVESGYLDGDAKQLALFFGSVAYDLLGDTVEWADSVLAGGDENVILYDTWES